MILNAGRHRRFGWLAGVVAAGVLALGAVGLSATAGTAATQASTTAATTATAAGTGASARARVPWSKVGRGWELAEYPARAAGKGAPATLYLISPAGVRYPMYTWGADATIPYLIAWSGDKTRVLLGLTGNTYEQLTLATGRLTLGRLPGRAQPAGYTLPDGLNILGVTVDGDSPETFARYSLAGKLLKVLIHSAGEGTAVYSANGATLAVSGKQELELVSNSGGVIRSLPVPGADPANGCDPERWWNATTILTQCIAKSANAPRLWLVPTNGKRPTPLTPQRSTEDLGDIDAWQLPSGVYLQASSSSGNTVIFRQAAHGSLTPVVPPHTAGNNTIFIVSALGARLLLLDAQTGGPGPGRSSSLLWFNPATHAEQWLLRAPVDAASLIDVLAYNSTENGQFF